MISERYMPRTDFVRGFFMQTVYTRNFYVYNERKIKCENIRIDKTIKTKWCFSVETWQKS